METRELKIQIPEEYCIDESKSTFEKIVFKKKDTKPRSWEEYCENHKGGYSFISSYNGGSITEIKFSSDELIKLNPESSKHTLPSKELAEAFLAMMQLMSLRQDWIHKWSVDNGMNDWKPDWKASLRKYGIVNDMNNISIVSYFYTSMPLSFPTEEMAADFMNCFKDLLEVAKPLI